MRKYVWLVVIAILLVAASGWADWTSTGLNEVDTDTDSGGGSDDDGEGDDIVSTVKKTIMDWAKAIAPAENVNTDYNNPGGLNMQGDLGSVPAAGGTGHDVIGVFSSLDAGYQALANVLAKYQNKYNDPTLLKATAIYVMGPNDPRTISGDYPTSVRNEAAVVAKGLGVDVNSTLSSIFGAA